MPSCISTFSTPMSSYTFLNILKHPPYFSLFTLLSRYVFQSFCLCAALLCFFLCGVHCFSSVLPLSFFPILHSGHKILLLFYSDTFLTIASFLPHSTYCTLVISPFLVSPSLQFHASWHEPYHTFFTCVMTNLLDDEETCNQ